jgi:1,4-alpha-glucan branching enzyme
VKTGRELICVGNFSAVPRPGYRLGLSHEGEYRAVINSDAEVYSGAGVFPVNDLQVENVASHGREYSALIDLPPLSTVWFAAYHRKEPPMSS